MSSPLASSSFFALITGGMNAPSEGKSKITIFNLVGPCAAAGRGAAHASAAKAAPHAIARTVLEIFVILCALPMRAIISLICGRRRCGQFAPKRGEKLLDQVLGHTFEDALADASNQAANLALARIGHRSAALGRRKRKRRFAIAVAERARARHDDFTVHGRLLVGKRDCAFEAAADRSDL